MTNRIQNRPTWSRLLLGGSTAALTAVSVFSSAYAQPPLQLDGIVIEGGTLDGRPVDPETVGTSVTVITAEELENSGTKFVSDALRRVPGVAVSRTGSFGGLTQVRIRGAEGNHVLVRIDGIEVSDTQFSEFDFSSLLTDNIQRIEVLRGGQSGLYGADAVAGVINIVTKTAKKGWLVFAEAEGGSFGTGVGRGRIAYGSDAFRFSASAAGLNTEGFDISAPGSEKDGYKNRTIHVKSDVDLAPWLNLNGVIRSVDRRGDTDGQEFDFGTTFDADAESATDELFGRAEATVSLFNDQWQQSVFITTGDIVRENFRDGAVSSSGEGTRRNFGYRSSLQFETPAFANARHTLTGLAEVEKETFLDTSPGNSPAQSVKRTRETRSIAGEYRLELFDSLFLTGTVRHDDFDGFEDTTTFRASGAYLLRQTGTKFHASYGEGIKAPSLIEQFGTGSSFSVFVPNPDLQPELSVGYDVGIEQSFFSGGLVIGATYFEADLENEIFSNFTFDVATSTSFVSPTNEDELSTRKGVEVAATIAPTDNIVVKATYTHLDAFETRDSLRQREVRRPEHSGSLDVFASFLDNRLRTNLGVIYNGDMDDLRFAFAVVPTGGRVVLDDYTTVRLAAEYDLTEQLTWFARGENVFSADYEEVNNFQTAGAAFYTGVRLNLQGE